VLQVLSLKLYYLCGHTLLPNNILVYFLLIPDEENESSEVHIGRMLQILREFSEDPVLSSYVIDDIWDDMKAMKVYSLHNLLFLIKLSCFFRGNIIIICCQ
jgi:hypothetical protein